MDSTGSSRKPNPNQASAKSSKGPRLYQLGIASAMSPSLMSSSGPSSENTAAFATNHWGSGMHHSTSTPQMYPSGFEDNAGLSSSRYRSGPSTFKTPGNPNVLSTSGASHSRPKKPTTPNDEFVRQTNLSHILEHSNGSPSRFLRTSPNPGNGNQDPSARASRPHNLGFGNISEGSQVYSQQVGPGPKSAPAQVNSFDQAAKYSNRGPWNQNLFDDRWIHNPEEMYVTNTRRASVLTISPDEIPHRTPQESNVSSAYPSSGHLELLQAQYGIQESAEVGAHGMVRPTTQLHSRVSPALPAGQSQEASSAISMGRGYDTLRAYVEVTANGQRRASVPELEQLMSTLLELRGDGDQLPSLQHVGQDNLRVYMYKRVFGVDDGNSALSQYNPSGRIDVAGYPVTRKALHEEIVHFIEDQVKLMTFTPGHDGQDTTLSQPRPQPIGNNDNREVDSRTHQRQYQTGRHSVEPSCTPEIPASNQVGFNQPIQGFNAMNLGGPDMTDQPHIPPNYGMTPAGQSSMASLYGQPSMNLQQQQQQYLSMLQQQATQQSSQFVPQQFMSPQGMVAGASYLPSQASSLAFYPGRQLNPQAGAFLPYGVQYLPPGSLAMSQFGGLTMQPQLLQNPQMALNAMAPHMSPFVPASVRAVQQLAPQWPHGPGRVYLPSSRTSSPMPRAQSRGGRNVISDVPYLPYRPGSDDMYPQATAEGSSVRLQELQREGPTYAYASKLEHLPFVENARQFKPSEWGVLKIGNIPYSLNKQEVLGFLGRNAKILTADIGTPIHIIMDRTNGKTMDCYVEFFSYGDAQAAFNKCLMRGNQLRLGDRVVDISMSSQDDLLREMFPKAKNVEWQHGRPVIKDSTDPYNSGFKSFVTNEELLQLVSYAEKPHRSNYTQKCLQRPYESMISVLSKFPWFAVDRYTIRTRDELFKQALRLISLLADQLRRGNEAYLPHLSESLQTELLFASLNAPAFSEQQRWQLCQAAGTVGDRIRMSPLVPYWPFEVLGRKAGVDEDFVQEYAEYLRRHPRNTSTEGFFGTWTAESNEALGLTTVGQVGSHEMQMILSMLRDVLPNASSL